MSHYIPEVVQDRASDRLHVFDWYQIDLV